MGTGEECAVAGNSAPAGLGEARAAGDLVVEGRGLVEREAGAEGDADGDGEALAPG